MVPRGLRLWPFARLTGFAPILRGQSMSNMRPGPKFKRAGEQFHDLSGGWREVADALAVSAGIPNREREDSSRDSEEFLEEISRTPLTAPHNSVPARWG
jgi:hypothetical protein